MNTHQYTPFLDQNSDALTSENSRVSKAEDCLKNERDYDNQKNTLSASEKSRGLLLEESRLVATFLYQKSPNTRLAYETDIKKFFSFFAGKTLREITPAHVVVFLKNHSELKKSSLSRLKSSLSSLFRYCVKHRYLESNPCEHLDPIKVPDQTQFRILSLEEVRRIIELEENPRNRFFIRFLARTGLRISEIISLTFENLKHRDGDYFLVVVGKGSKTRTIKIPEEFYNKAMTFIYKDGEKLPSKTPIFRGKSTLKKLSTKSGWDIVKKAAVRAGLSEEVSPHWLRHFHATHSLKLGDDLRVIQKTLGHESITTTTKYVNVDPSQSSGEGMDI